MLELQKVFYITFLIYFLFKRTIVRDFMHFAYNLADFQPVWLVSNLANFLCFNELHINGSKVPHLPFYQTINLYCRLWISRNLFTLKLSKLFPLIFSKNFSIFNFYPIMHKSFRLFVGNSEKKLKFVGLCWSVSSIFL